MEILFINKEETHRIEIYNEYLKKIPELLKQLETVEKMYQKAQMEMEMMSGKNSENQSVALYQKRLSNILKQCETRSADIRQQCSLIFELKKQVEAESSILRQLADS